LFLVVSSWSFLPLFIVEIGGKTGDAGLIMGAMGITSLGALPVLSPLIDRYGRRLFLIAGVLLAGLSNAGFLLFTAYSPVIAAVRLVQGLAFAASFNACSTAVVDLLPAESRAYGIGVYGISSSLAAAIGPYLAEYALLSHGFTAYFILLVVYGAIGFLIALLVAEPGRATAPDQFHGFFPTATRGRHLPMMATTAVLGAGFGAINAFFPLHAKVQGLHSGMFFVLYGISLLVIRLLLGPLVDRVRREKLIIGSLVGYGLMLALTAYLCSPWHVPALGALFGTVQGIAYPSMMARMVDRSHVNNRAVVVGLFTGSFGVGIHLSVLLWGYLADACGLDYMYSIASAIVLVYAGLAWTAYYHVQRRGESRLG
jgi:MFS family permease